MFCPNCGNEMNDNAIFCSECGWKNSNQVVSKNNAKLKHINNNLKNNNVILIGVFFVLAIIIFIKVNNSKTIVYDVFSGDTQESYEINKNEYKIYDFDKMSYDEKIKAFNECFNVSFSYDGLPSIVLDNTAITNTLKSSGFGDMLVQNFCEEHRPYLIYSMSVKIKKGYVYDWNIDKRFRVKVLDYNFNPDGYYNEHTLFGQTSDVVYWHLRCDDMPNEKTTKAWITTVNNTNKYKNKINKTIDDLKSQLYGLDVSSMKGIIYKKEQ